MNGYSRIVRAVAVHTGIHQALIMSRHRSVVVANARMLAMYLAYEVCQNSSAARVGMFFDRDHTTVLHAIEKICHTMQTDDVFAESVRQLRQGLET